MQGKVLAPLSPFSTTMCFLLMCSLEVGYLPAQCGLSADTSVPSPLGHWGRGLPRAQWGASGSVWWYSFFSLETLLWDLRPAGQPLKLEHGIWELY